MLRRLANFISSANLYKSAAGSVPTDKTKINGVVADESRKTRCKSAVYKKKLLIDITYMLLTVSIFSSCTV